MIMEKMIEETKMRNDKANNLVISGLPENSGDNSEEEDKKSIVNIMNHLGIVNAENKISKTRRIPRMNRDSTVVRASPLVVELSDKSTRDRVLRMSRELKNNDNYKSVYINPDLTTYEMEIEKQLRIRRNIENDKLEFSNGRLKYGKTNEGVEFYWGIRFGKVCRIDRNTKRSI